MHLAPKSLSTNKFGRYFCAKVPKQIQQKGGRAGGLQNERGRGAFIGFPMRRIAAAGVKARLATKTETKGEVSESLKETCLSISKVL